MIPSNQQPTNRKLQQSIMLMFFSIVSGVILFLLAAIVIADLNGPLMPDLHKQHEIILLFLSVITLACLIFARQLWHKNVQGLRISLENIPAKLVKYRSALVKYMLLCELPILVAIVLFILTGNFVFAVYAAVLIGFLLVKIPLRRKIAAEMELNWEEQRGF